MNTTDILTALYWHGLIERPRDNLMHTTIEISRDHNNIVRCRVTDRFIDSSIKIYLRKIEIPEPGQMIRYRIQHDESQNQLNT